MGDCLKHGQAWPGVAVQTSVNRSSSPIAKPIPRRLSAIRASPRMSAFVYFAGSPRLASTSNIRRISNSRSRIRFVALQKDIPVGCACVYNKENLALLKRRPVPTMSQDAALFSVRRPREVRLSQRSPMDSTIPIISTSVVVMLTLTVQDSRRHKLQHLYSTACLRPQAL